MAQYRNYQEGEYDMVTDAVTGLRVRFGQRSGKYVEDVELSVGGFSLAEDVGWVNLSDKSGAGTGDMYRIGARDESFVIDADLVDNTWENLAEQKPV